jgi:hypothetical protein
MYIHNITHHLVKDDAFEWTPACTAAFDVLKVAFTSFVMS